MAQVTEISYSQCKCLEDLENLTVAGLKHCAVGTSRPEETKTLINLLNVLDYRQVVVFTNNSTRSEVLSQVLNQYGHAADYMHALMPRQVRCFKYSHFRRMTGGSNIMVMSGFGHVMESEYVDVVVNFDMVETPLAYMHRASSRQVREGMVVTILRSEEEMTALKQVEKMQHVKIEPLPSDIYNRLVRSPIPVPVTSTP